MRGELQEVTYTASASPFRFPMALVRLPEHKNADFVLEMPENGGLGGQKRTKTLILCSKRLKMRGPKAKSAQKWDFCALFCFERPLTVGLDVCG